jgi:hypothetical protein
VVGSKGGQVVAWLQDLGCRAALAAFEKGWGVQGPAFEKDSPQAPWLYPTPGPGGFASGGRATRIPGKAILPPS